ncbi:hypothetical protein SSX86_018247 [Deinandra increscens subsp. villosa]|uniref:MSP domain-containing protein n=1 Tax=Deinandra increscens subsp. villosa TaxID=3103831 RepID=A0AAP0CVP3_9ASTR
MTSLPARIPAAVTDMEVQQWRVDSVVGRKTAVADPFWVFTAVFEVPTNRWSRFTNNFERDLTLFRKVKTTNPKRYCVRPNTGVVLPHSTCEVIGSVFPFTLSVLSAKFLVLVTMQSQKEAPLDMQCKDKFLLQSAVARPGTTPKDITPELFNKDSGNQVEECKLKVNYVAPQQPPSPVREGSKEGSSPRASISENGTINTTDSTAVPRGYIESPEKPSKVISRATPFTCPPNPRLIIVIRRQQPVAKKGETPQKKVVDDQPVNWDLIDIEVPYCK